MSEDEFDQLSDPFSGVDWSTVPELASAPSAPHPDRHQTPHAAELPQSTHRAEPSEEDAATEYSFDDLDDAFLAHIDEVESRMRTQDSARGGSESAIASRFFHCENIAHTPNVLPSTLQASRPNERSSASVQSTSNGKLDRTHSYSSSKCIGPMSVSETENRPPRITRELSSPSVRESPPKRHKGKQKESPRAILREFLNGFEEEMTCPICCDIFASAHLGNPCGHSFCGECGLRWMKKNREAPTCAICRASLSADAPMIPNFAMDNAVDKHVHALRASAIEGWGDGEIKFIEWQARKTRWKADSTKQKSKKKATVSLAMVIAPFALGRNDPDSDFIEEEYDEESTDEGSIGVLESSEEEPEEAAVVTATGRGRRRHRGANRHRGQAQGSGRQRNRGVVERNDRDARGTPGPPSRGRRSRHRRR